MHKTHLSKTKRIAFISSAAFAIVQFRGSLIQDLVGLGFTIYALAPDYSDHTREAVKALGATPIDSPMSRTGKNPLRDLIDAARLTLRLRRLHIDMMFANFIKPVIFGTLAAWIARIPHRCVLIEGAGYIFTEAESFSVKRALLRRLVVPLYRLALTRAHCVLMLNQDDIALFLAYRMVSTQKIRLIDGIGLNLDVFQMTPPVMQPISFLMVGRLLLEKGIYDYVNAARLVKKTWPSARFILVGGIDANPGSVTEACVKAWVAEGVIEWPGQVADVRRWIAQASVFVLPSYREGLPRSTQEAMAMGRPVITTDVPGCRQTVVDGDNGFLVPVRDPSALADAMLRFLDSPDLVTSMGERSREMAERRFDVRKINQATYEAIELFS